MCGIVGTYNVLHGRAEVSRGLEVIEHRGPDASMIDELRGVVLGHVRLAIHDLDARSAQPWVCEDGSLLAFNGEIWNWRELREELGGTWNTTSDTEVLARALITWGVEETLPRLEGMFAFCFVSSNTLIAPVLVRDRFGVIPFYVRRQRSIWRFSSERKAFDVGMVPVPAGSIINMRTGVISKWFDPLAELPEADPSKVLDQLDEAVRKRLSADVPVCCLLSGGLDSSIILKLVKRHKPDVIAYVAYLDENSPDLAAARQFARQIDVELREVQVPAITPDDLEAAVSITEIASQAQNDITLVCEPLAERVARDGFKVVLSGESADEVFGGYGNMIMAANRGEDWRAVRLAAIEKMARGNFPRVNKVFMKHSIESRLPFIDHELVLNVLAMTKDQCPPAKKLLKQVGEELGLPSKLVKRQKETFQGASGSAEAAESIVANRKRFYNAVARKNFGRTEM